MKNKRKCLTKGCKSVFEAVGRQVYCKACAKERKLNYHRETYNTMNEDALKYVKEIEQDRLLKNEFFGDRFIAMLMD